MKKIALFTASLMFFAAGTFAQIPNWNWESWTNHSKDAPSQWSTFGKTDKVSPGANGSYAVRLQAEPSGGSKNNPGVVLYGNPNGNNFTGGVPFAARPDSLVAYFKYSIVPGDSAWVLISFQKSGTTISSDLYRITGSFTSGFQRKSFKINFMSGLTPDTVFLAFTSTRPMESQSNPNSYVIVDNISFTGTTVNVPNPDFESWTTVSYETPNGWDARNDYNISNTVKSTSAFAGNYALKLQTMINNGDTMQGYIQTLRPPNADPNTFGPAFPMNSRPDSMMLFAKFFPENNDTGFVNIVLFKNSQPVGFGGIQIIGTHSSYTPFACRINYNGLPSGNPDSGTISISTFSTNGMNSRPRGNSILYIDNMSFDQYIMPVGLNEEPGISDLTVFPNPANKSINILLNGVTNGRAEISLSDLSGKIIIHEEASIINGAVAIDLSGIDKGGMYFVKINSGNNIFSRKILKY